MYGNAGYFNRLPFGGPRELIKDDENGLLVPVSDEKKLTQALRKITDTEFSDKIGRDAFSIRERMTDLSVFEAWESVLLSKK